MSETQYEILHTEAGKDVRIIKEDESRANTLNANTFKATGEIPAVFCTGEQIHVTDKDKIVALSLMPSAMEIERDEHGEMTGLCVYYRSKVDYEDMF